MATSRRRRPGQLPPGRHGIPAQKVRADQRARIVRAAGEVAGEIGYSDMSVEAVIALAGVSRRTFYEHFSNKRDAVMAAIAAGEVKLPAVSKRDLRLALTPFVGKAIAEAVADETAARRKAA